jgi:hypothetical protein
MVLSSAGTREKCTSTMLLSRRGDLPLEHIPCPDLCPFGVETEGDLGRTLDEANDVTEVGDLRV